MSKSEWIARRNNADSKSALGFSKHLAESLKTLYCLSFKDIFEDNKVVPNHSGIYVFISEKNEILYVGKAKNLASRLTCAHHKLGELLLCGAKDIRIAPVPNKMVWAVEQRLIYLLKPLLNKALSKWWENPAPPIKIKPECLGVVCGPRPQIQLNITETALAQLNKLSEDSELSAEYCLESLLMSQAQFCQRIPFDIVKMQKLRKGKELSSKYLRICLDERVFAAIGEMAKDQGLSFSSYVMRVLSARSKKSVYLGINRNLHLHAAKSPHSLCFRHSQKL